MFMVCAIAMYFYAPKWMAGLCHSCRALCKLKAPRIVCAHLLLLCLCIVAGTLIALRMSQKGATLAYDKTALPDMCKYGEHVFCYGKLAAEWLYFSFCALVSSSFVLLCPFHVVSCYSLEP